MSTRNKRQRDRKKGRSPNIVGRAVDDESAAAQALTTSWMLAILTSLLCNLGAIFAHVAIPIWPDAAGWQLLAGFLLFGSVVVGTVTLLLTPLVYKALRTPPPRQLVGFGVVLALAPLVTLLMRLIM